MTLCVAPALFAKESVQRFVGCIQHLRTVVNAQPGSLEPLSADHIAAINLALQQVRILPRGVQAISFIDPPRPATATSGTERCSVQMDEAALRICLPSGASAARAFSAVLRAPPLVAVAAAAWDADPRGMALDWDFGDLGRGRAAAFSAADPRSLLIPDHEYFNSDGYDEAKRAMQAAFEPWQARGTRVFWRGSTTGMRRPGAPLPRDADDWGWLPRLDLCDRCRHSPHAAMLDVGISAICQIAEPPLVAAIQASGLMRPPAGRALFMAQKWNLVIDGNSNAWGGLFLALCSGVCAIVVESARGYRQWYYDRLRPWEHFVPVKQDMSDLDSILDWCLAHESQSAAIAAAGRSFALGLVVEDEVTRCGAALAQWITAQA